MAGRLLQFSTPKCQPQLSRQQRKRLGIFYTPPEIVRLIVELVLRPQSLKGPASPRVLDHACGAGEFLLAVQRRLSADYGPQAARQGIFGVDIDREAVATARSRLRAADRCFLTSHIACGDGLSAELLSLGPFDVIVGNPPYVNIRQLAKNMPPAEIALLRERYRTARGNFDLYALFIERAIELLRPGGRCALVVPNKWATLDYARPCRELLLQHTAIEHVVDFTDSRAFADAAVYPHVLVFRKQPANANHVVRFRRFDEPRTQEIKQQALSAVAIHLSTPLEVESRVGSVPLGEVAALRCGTAGYMAEKIAQRLVDAADSLPCEDAADFITSGNIDRYAIRSGNVRYLKRDYLRPRLPLDIPELTAVKRQLFNRPKIVIAGMSKRLEAAWDVSGLALGVQVFAASPCQIDPHYLLAVLNSKLLSYLFTTRFSAKRLGGGYFAINKGQLAQLPVRLVSSIDRKERRLHDRLSRLAASWTPAHDAEIDRIVYQLYRLTAAEIRRVESHFVERVVPTLSAKAARKAA